MPDWLLAIVYVITPWIVLIRGLPWFSILIQILIAAPFSLAFHAVLTALLQKFTTALPYSRRMVSYGSTAVAWLVFLLLVQVILRHAPDGLYGLRFARHFNALMLIGVLAWLGVRIARAISHTILELHPADVADNYYARRIHTQTKVLARVVMGLIVLIGISCALMTLPLLRQLGTSLLASAGVAGIVLGLAAKPVLGNLLAGLQIALSQPIRLDDVVIVQNEWGQIEEITGTYVVVRIWDQRRLIIPLQWFIENPFQNWTRRTADILGTVFLWVDYRMPLDALREQAQRICETAPEWDGRLCLLQVFEAGEKAIQLRVLVSAGDAGKAWDLRCRVREGLVDFIQRHYPAYLPRIRAEINDLGDISPQSMGNPPPGRH